MLMLSPPASGIHMALDLEKIHRTQQQYFARGMTITPAFRRAALTALQQALRKNYHDIVAALHADLCKPAFEALVGEIDVVEQELAYARRHLKRWMARRRVRTPLLHFPARSYTQYEPRGCVLIISPWNYPLQLALSPLIAALAAGNCVILKPSEHAPQTSTLLHRMLSACFPPEHVQVINGGIETSSALLDLPFDHIFFIGSNTVGKIVMTKAARHLASVTLELGGKSPCIVDRNVPLRDTARRIVWAKFFNSGQSCIAPDYLLVHKDSHDELLTAMRSTIVAFYGDNPQQSASLARIINRQHCERLISYLKEGNIVHGGQYNLDDNFIAPTLLSDCHLDSRVMQEEIFGPVLPIFTFADNEQLAAIVAQNKNPLALYLYSRDKERIDFIMQHIAFGSGCINDNMIQYGIIGLPFGGKGSSGFGKCHGRHGFVSFSHQKSITQRAFGFDLKVRFPPYAKNLRWLKILLRLGRPSL